RRAWLRPVALQASEPVHRRGAAENLPERAVGEQTLARVWTAEQLVVRDALIQPRRADDVEFLRGFFRASDAGRCDVLPVELVVRVVDGGGIGGSRRGPVSLGVRHDIAGGVVFRGDATDRDVLGAARPGRLGGPVRPRVGDRPVWVLRDAGE